MEKHHDENIDCADCGAPFVFTADEAAVFAARGLAAPKRCRDCRRARKERAAGGGARDGHRPPFSGGGPRWGAPDAHPVGSAPYAARGRGDGRDGAPLWNGRQPRAPRYTGDVNEYRSPMQDGSSAAPRWVDPRVPPRFAAARGGFSNAGGPRVHPNARGPRAGTGGGGGAGGHAGHVGAVDPARPREANGKPPRRRPEAEMFSITCDACGARAEVPFKPAEGREVYCPSCYRARRPSP